MKRAIDYRSIFIETVWFGIAVVWFLLADNLFWQILWVAMGVLQVVLILAEIFLWSSTNPPRHSSYLLLGLSLFLVFSLTVSLFDLTGWEAAAYLFLIIANAILAVDQYFLLQTQKAQVK